jgi:hypothetical protein
VSTDALVVALDDADEHVQSAALDALAESGQAERPAVLSRVAAIALRDARWWMRRRAVFALAHAAEALGEARAAGAVDALAAACAEDAEPRVREAARAALRTLGIPPSFASDRRALSASPRVVSRRQRLNRRSVRGWLSIDDFRPVPLHNGAPGGPAQGMVAKARRIGLRSRHRLWQVRHVPRAGCAGLQRLRFGPGARTETKCE